MPLRSFAASNRFRAAACRFASETRGSVAVMTVILSVPLFIAVGVAIDTAEIYRARENLQQAADAAVLGAAQAVMTGATEDAARAEARALFDAQIANLDASKATLTIDPTKTACNAGELVATAHLEHALFFPLVTGLAVAGASDGSGITVTSAANCGNDTVEIALVLDNSGSMAGSKIQSLRDAASKLVQDMFTAGAASSRPDPVSFSVVPFASMVNVGSANAGALWMDRFGDAPEHHENLDWAHAGARRDGNRWYSGDTALTRFLVYQHLGVAWRGCVEKRRHPLHLSDAPADAARDRFVPSFAPDEPDNWTGERERAERDGKDGDEISEWSYRNSYLRDDHAYPHHVQSRNHHHPDLTGAPFGQIYRQFWVSKYFYDATVYSSRPGPNDFCEAQPLLPLSTVESDILASIESMSAAGATDVQAGVSWGWKTLSPGAPFEEGRDYGEARNTKVMIVMTDGANTYYPNYRPTRSHYGAFGQAWTGRIFAGTGGGSHSQAGYTAAMDAHLSATCANARAAGLVIYTIAFDVPADSPVHAVMRDCASTGEGGKLAFDAADETALASTFERIGRSIQRLKLTR